MIASLQAGKITLTNKNNNHKKALKHETRKRAREEGQHDEEQYDRERNENRKQITRTGPTRRT